MWTLTDKHDNSNTCDMIHKIEHNQYAEIETTCMIILYIKCLSKEIGIWGMLKIIYGSPEGEHSIL